MRRLARPAAACLAALVLLTSAGCDAIALISGEVAYPEIDPVAGQPTVKIERRFRFESKDHTIRLDVHGGVYAGARKAEKKAVKSGSFDDVDWIPGYYRAFIDEPHQEEMYDALLAAFRRIRDSEGLDSDRYAELMAAFVQSIDYRIDPSDLSPKFPVETLAQNAGDCDDKSLLLAGLLAREGYDVSILFFEPEKHVAVGLASEKARFKDEEYAFIETTRQSIVGFVPERLGQGDITLQSKPRVITVGKGSVPYMSGMQVESMTEALARTATRRELLADRLEDLDTQRKQLETRVTELRRELTNARASRDGGKYSAAVTRYNAAVEEYNAVVDDMRPLAAEHNRLVEAETYVWDHQDDRPAVYQYVASKLG